ncbi:hypothetical protein ASPVEDRAFT_165930 [Aspergillus versicolor CBS 583.65]|uniref:Clr5 domain-containing protein n=1 Tax=Aspergillus versicolor CBS 583.65 TaxID=1036611 RepID=A0A1L9PH22_ASPVE|nr:uncharacterized protein ASPVEDRAFT_165930 [Aspergillus versicolor CBS 583.65]OJJ00811.1 hypothetical protein ASPVEDRAFT_165930 [Aspergillus versicolor CBS 583.65]
MNLQQIAAEGVAFEIIPAGPRPLHKAFSIENGGCHTVGFCNFIPTEADQHGWGRRALQVYRSIPLAPPRDGWTRLQAEDMPPGRQHRAWESLTDPIKRISHDLAQSRPDLLAILALVYSFRVTPGSLDKAITRFNLQVNKGTADETQEGNSVGEPSKPRKRKRNPEAHLIGAWTAILANKKWTADFRKALEDNEYARTVPTISDPRGYQLQERMLASVNDYIFYLFESQKWKFNSTEMLDPAGYTSAGTGWKQLSDQVWGAGSLFREGNSDAGMIKLGQAQRAISAAVMDDSPQLMWRLWRICRYLYGICVSTKDDAHLKARFLVYLRDVRAATKGDHDPVSRVFDALAEMDMDCLVWALRIGHLRTLQSFQNFVGPGHPVVLSMWVYYMKQWNIGNVNHGMITQYYQSALETADRLTGPASHTAISILHDYTYFIYYTTDKKCSMEISDLGMRLYNRALSKLSQPCIWSNETQYFAFASQILAEYWFLQNNEELGRPYIYVGVQRLQGPDRECQIRAAMLLGQLRRWLLRWNRIGEAEEVRESISALKESMDGLLQDEIRVSSSQDES